MQLMVCVCVFHMCRLTKGVEEQARVEHEGSGGPAHQQETRYDDHHTLYSDIEEQSYLQKTEAASDTHIQYYY